MNFRNVGLLKNSDDGGRHVSCYLSFVATAVLKLCVGSGTKKKSTPLEQSNFV